MCIIRIFACSTSLLRGFEYYFDFIYRFLKIINFIKKDIQTYQYSLSKLVEQAKIHTV